VAAITLLLSITEAAVSYVALKHSIKEIIDSFIYVVRLKIQVFWDMKLCRLVNSFQRFGEA
jgi:hypothetical protein